MQHLLSDNNHRFPKYVIEKKALHFVAEQLFINKSKYWLHCPFIWSLIRQLIVTTICWFCKIEIPLTDLCLLCELTAKIIGFIIYLKC